MDGEIGKVEVEEGNIGVNEGGGVEAVNGELDAGGDQQQEGVQEDGNQLVVGGADEVKMEDDLKENRNVGEEKEEGIPPAKVVKLEEIEIKDEVGGNQIVGGNCLEVIKEDQSASVKVCEKDVEEENQGEVELLVQEQELVNGDLMETLGNEEEFFGGEEGSVRAAILATGQVVVDLDEEEDSGDDTEEVDDFSAIPHISGVKSLANPAQPEEMEEDVNLLDDIPESPDNLLSDSLDTTDSLEEERTPTPTLVNLVEGDDDSDIEVLFERECQNVESEQKDDSSRPRKRKLSETEELETPASGPVNPQVAQVVVDLAETDSEDECVRLDDSEDNEDGDNKDDQDKPEVTLQDESLSCPANPAKKLRSTDAFTNGRSSPENIMTRIRFDSAESFTSYLEKFSDAEKTPLDNYPISSVEIKTPLISDLAQFWESAGKMLSVHGTLVEFLLLDITGTHSETEVHKWITQVLLHTPNLQSLQIKYKGSDEDHPTGRLLTVAENLPTFNNLTELNLEEAVLPSLVNFVLVETCGQTVKKVGMPINSWSLEMLDNLSQLEELSVSEINHETVQNLDQLLKSVQKKAKLRDKVETVKLTLPGTLLNDELLLKLEPFKSLLKLKFILHDALDLENGKTPEVRKEAPKLENGEETEIETIPELSSVKSISVSLSALQRTFGFLQRMPNLETLELDQVSPSNYGLVAGEKVDVIDMEMRKLLARNSAQKSGIWELLPNLKGITVKWANGLDKENQEFRREECG